jgi:imidazolonepropionase
MEIMNRGGGIVSTTAATHTASSQTLVEKSLILLNDMLSQGITTVEGKRYDDVRL